MAKLRALEEYFLSSRAPEDLIYMTLETLEPFGNYAERDAYCLARAADLSKTEISQNLGLATRKTIRSLKFVSAAESFSRPETFNEELALRLHYNQFRNPFWKTIMINFGGALSEKVDIQGDKLWQVINESIGEKLRGALCKTVGARVGNDCLWDNIWLPLFYFAGFVLIGDAVNFNPLLPIVRDLAKYIPIGGDKRREWTILTA